MPSLPHRTRKLKNVKSISLNRREGACSFRRKNVANLHNSPANPQDVTCSHWISKYFWCLLPEGAEPLPYIESRYIVRIPQPCTSSKAYTDQHTMETAPYEKNGVFRICLVTLKRRKLFGALNIRGILTPVCALAQNDRSFWACNSTS